jgi:DNA-binding NtrC family response regulator
MRAPRDPIVSAFYNMDHSKMISLLDSAEKETLAYRHYRALCLFLYPLEIKEKAKEKIARDALEEPPEDVELFILLLWSFVIIAVNANRLADAQRAVELMKQLAREGISNDIQTSILRSELRVQLALGDYEKQLNILSNALQLNRPGTRSWAVLKADRILASIENEDFALARSDLETLRPYHELALNSQSGSFDFLYSYFLYSCGRLDEALIGFRKKVPDEQPQIQRSRIRLFIQCLIKTGFKKEAVIELAGARNRLTDIWPPTPQTAHLFFRWEYENLRAFEALAIKDFQLAREHAQIALNTVISLHPSHARESQRLMLWVDLAAAHTRSARVLLQILDPRESKSIYASEWARLYMLEGDRAKAIFHIGKVATHGMPELLEDKFRYAYELSSSQTVGLVLNLNSRRIKSVPSESEESKSLETTFPELIGSSLAIRRIRSLIQKFAQIKTSILISGEPGTGKRTVAQLLHARSTHSSEPFISVNCDSSSNTLIESELFGHRKGAFTDANRDREGFFLEAGKGTVFLDKVERLSPSVQAGVLRVLEQGKVQPLGGDKLRFVQSKIIGAANKPLENILRKDLYFFLERVQISIPPLRERIEDISVLAEHFLKKIYGKCEVTLGNDLIELLKRYSWPGNVRQLKEEIKRIAMAAGDSPVLHASMFQPSEKAVVSAKITRSSINLSNSFPRISREDAIYGNYTMSRQQKIRELFLQREKVTRADIIHLFRCAPDTATRDLKYLEQEGWIRRVTTSGNLRTSYFVRVQD